jgi:hypothetical protein
LICDCKRVASRKVAQKLILLYSVSSRETARRRFALRREEIPSHFFILHVSQNLPPKAAAMAAGGGLMVAANPAVYSVNWRSVAGLSRVCEGAQPWPR